jgi:L-threonylcarbamoyladenylate synthase
MNAHDDALAALRAGRLVVLPTDTVYGVAASPSQPEAIAAIFRVKGRPQDKPLPVLGADLEQLLSIAVFDERAERLAARFWPGPLTLVLPRAAGFDADLGGAGRDSVAVRVPASDVTRALLAEAGPLAVTSANLSGRPDPASVAEARTALGDAVAVYVDSGPAGGLPSTVVSLLGEPEVLRIGALDAAELRAVL